MDPEHRQKGTGTYRPQQANSLPYFFNSPVSIRFPTQIERTASFKMRNFAYVHKRKRYFLWGPEYDFHGRPGSPLVDLMTRGHARDLARIPARDYR
jgi:hypothetical protein